MVFVGYDLVLYLCNEVLWMWEDLCGELIMYGCVVLQSNLVLVLFEVVVVGIGIIELVCCCVEVYLVLVCVLFNCCSMQDVWFVMYVDLYKIVCVWVLFDCIVEVFDVYKKIVIL